MRRTHPTYLFSARVPKGTRAILAGLRQSFTSTISGTPEVVIEQFEAYAEVGVEELMIQWFNLDDYDGLQLLAEAVLPHFMA